MKNFNLDFSQKIVVDTNNQEWIDSPAMGVRRIPLEREEAESGHVTSIVEYMPGASFNSHIHPLGEEIFVLDGVFSDENGDYNKGSYIRNPPGSSHAPFSRDGCILYVKLNQMKSLDNNHVQVDSTKRPWQQGYGGLKVMSLHQFGTESVALVKWPSGEKFVEHSHLGGEEIFVLEGEFIDNYGRYPKGTWIRSPHLSVHHPYVEEETIILVKTGHLN